MCQDKEAYYRNRVRIIVKGIVQGVGFRPYVYNLARSLNLKGHVRNTDDGIIIEIDGDLIECFIESLTKHPPPLSNVTSVDITVVEHPDIVYHDFSIQESVDGRGFTLTSPDVAVCDDCLTEMMNEHDRRYLYPFINCTNCGPRYTITERVPYDRKNTTMNVFKMCDDCNTEYNDPQNRRFHAQPNACPVCGPSLSFESSDGPVNDDSLLPIDQALCYIDKGKIIALRGLGGFHICCDALNENAVSRLRKQKRENNKPFALMAPDMDTITEYCEISEREKSLLLSPKRPIVLLNRKPGIPIPDAIAPGIKYLGFMLPYTPLHYLLFHYPGSRDHALKCLVMTSGNLSEEPIVIDNLEAMTSLAKIADGFLLHNRNIFMRADDSVSLVLEDEERIRPFTVLVRRARGYVPEVIALESEGPEVLGVGGDLKNTFTLTKGKYAIPSQHIGDMENFETLNFFEETLCNLKSVFRVNPVAVGYDMHPGYHSTKWAIDQKDVQSIPVQHHHAHVASVMAGHGLNENVIGVIMDGTGYGTDGNLWGGEFFISNGLHYSRVGHFSYVPLIGGESSIKNPWKTAVSFIIDAVADEALRYIDNIGFVEKFGEKNIENLLSLSCNQEFSPLSSGAGRIFDAVAAITGTCSINTFEAEAPMRLESLVREDVNDDYPVNIILNEPFEIDFSVAIISILKDVMNGVDVRIISTRFHNTIISIIVKMVSRLKDNMLINKVVLSGGSFQNRYVLSKSIAFLRKEGLEVFVNKSVPCNDAGISLGQAYIVREMIKRGL